MCRMLGDVAEIGGQPFIGGGNGGRIDHDPAVGKQPRQDRDQGHIKTRLDHRPGVHFAGRQRVHASFLTAFRNASPRAAKSRYISKLAQAGASSAAGMSATN